MEPIRYGVPPPFPFEAPSSWLSRLALAQGQPLKRLAKYLLLDPTMDLDTQISLVGMRALRERCSLAPNAFGVAESLLGSLAKIALVSGRLHRDERGCAAFAYCPCCMRARPIAHLEIHWRFVDWRYCPLHSCLMETRCSACAAQQVFPRDMALSKAGKVGHATQRRCQVCTHDLGNTPPTYVDLPIMKATHPLEAHWLMNGRALMAALIRGHWTYRGSQARLKYLRGGALQFFLPSDWQWEQAEARIRHLSSAASQVRIASATSDADGHIALPRAADIAATSAFAFKAATDLIARASERKST